jgi:putative flippase GtrA
MSLELRRTLRRWVRFNTVGVAGAAIQLLALWLLTGSLGIRYVFATAVAVEIALLHNFVWHEVWTWKGSPLEYRWRRLLQFHLTNGIVSMSANTLFTWVFAHYAGMPLLAANLAAIAMTGVLNFALADALVFAAPNQPS